MSDAAGAGRVGVVGAAGKVALSTKVHARGLKTT